MMKIETLRARLSESCTQRLGDACAIGCSTDPRLGVRAGQGRLECVIGPHTEASDGVCLAAGPEAPSLAVVAAIVSSQIVGTLLDADPARLGELPLPEVPRLSAAQLEVLWRRYEASDAAEREAIVGAFDRIVAELYELTLDELMILERHLGE